jgi:hypothetical protein
MGFIPAILAGMVGMILGLYAVDWYVGKPQRRRRQLRGVHRVPIAELGEGQVGRLVGTVSGEPIPAPISGRPCLCWFVLVEEGVNLPRPIIRASGGVPFELADGSGRALIDPTGAEIDVDLDVHRHSGGVDRPTELERAFLDRYHRRSGGSYRYHEGIIPPGATAAVVGSGTRELDRDAAAAADRGYRDAAPTLLRMRPDQARPLLVTDQRDLVR